MRGKILGLVMTIFLVTGFLPISFAAPCPTSTPTCRSDKPFPGRFCYQGQDVTDIILEHYTIGEKFYLPDGIKILGCEYHEWHHWCGNTASKYLGPYYKKFSISEGGEITYSTVKSYSISSDLGKEDIVRIMKNWVYKIPDFTEDTNKRDDLPLETSDVDSTELTNIKNSNDYSALENMIIYEVLSNTANRLSLEEGVTASYNSPAASYGKLVVNRTILNITKNKLANAINSKTTPSSIPVTTSMIPSLSGVTKKSELKNFLKSNVTKGICDEENSKENITCSYSTSGSSVSIIITNITEGTSTEYEYDADEVINYLESQGDIYTKTDYYYIAFEKVFEQLNDEGLVSVTEEIVVDIGEAEGEIIANNVLTKVLSGLGHKLLKLFW